MSAAAAFGARVREVLAAQGRLCVGIDPHEHLLAAWGLESSAAGAREFGLRVVDAAAGRVGIVKPQVSFFERYGAAGYVALEDVLAAARAAHLLVIADAKRGDIGTTMDAYARAWLTQGSPLEADAMTVSPFLGVGSLLDTFRLALENGKGVFVLAATSNPEAAALQGARQQAGGLGRSPIEGARQQAGGLGRSPIEGARQQAGGLGRSPIEGARQQAGGLGRSPIGEETVAAGVIREVSAFNAESMPPDEWGSIGFVIGATVDRRIVGLPETISPMAPILAPGFGHQGARPEQLAELFGGTAPSVIASESRSLLSAGADGMAAAIESRIEQYRSPHG